MRSYGSAPDGGLSQRRRVSCWEETSAASDGSNGAEGCIYAQKSKQGRLGQVSYAISATWSTDNETQSGMEHRHLLHNIWRTDSCICMPSLMSIAVI